MTSIFPRNLNVRFCNPGKHLYWRTKLSENACLCLTSVSWQLLILWLFLWVSSSLVSLFDLISLSSLTKRPHTTHLPLPNPLGSFLFNLHSSLYLVQDNLANKPLTQISAECISLVNPKANQHNQIFPQSKLRRIAGIWKSLLCCCMSGWCRWNWSCRLVWTELFFCLYLLSV